MNPSALEGTSRHAWVAAAAALAGPFSAGAKPADAWDELGEDVAPRVEKTEFVGHDRGRGGIRSFAGFFPQSRRAVVVLANTDVDAGTLEIDVPSRLKSLPPGE